MKSQVSLSRICCSFADGILNNFFDLEVAVTVVIGTSPQILQSLQNYTLYNVSSLNLFTPVTIYTCEKTSLATWLSPTRGYERNASTNYSPSRIETEGMQGYGTCICVYSTSV